MRGESAENDVEEQPPPLLLPGQLVVTGMD
jgi:hypothetical protein